MNDDRTRGRKIHVLDISTVNRIAAGEVVERPASVVKELVENAIDAGATTVRVEIASAAGMVTAIRVIDDGSGMSPDDAVLAFTPHATSKITDISDLETVGTLGFRGEALSSIAAVSRVTLLTKERGSGSVAGTKVVIAGGKVLETGEAGAPDGTNVLVEDLFATVPARKKFLKTLATELAHIMDVIEGIAIARPEVALRLSHNGRELIATERSTRLIDTVARLFGTDVVPALIPVNYRHPFLNVTGYISLPSVLRKSQGRILVAINRRYVSSLPIATALIEGYGTLIPKDRYPLAFLSVTTDTRSVDVNVHPAKKLVRLSREGQVRDIVRDAVRTALRSADLIPSPVTKHSAAPLTGTSLPVPVRYDHARTSGSIVSEPTHAGSLATDRQLRQTELVTGTAPEPGLVPAMELIGQFGGIYLLAATAGGDLIVIDQHAAHERILYELVSARGSSVPLTQELIVPVVLERPARDAALIRSLLPALAEEGFAISEFGRNSFLVSAVPVILGKTDEAAGMISDIVDDLTREDLKNPVTRREQVTRIIACRGAIKAGTVCTGDQCRRLLQQLARTKNPWTCPHGRPTMVRLTRMELDTMFKRTGT